MPQLPLLTPSFDLAEGAISVVIATIASYAALTLAGRVGALRGREHSGWLLGGGIAMGLGIAAMHFVGMLAMELPIGVAYESGRTVLSVIVAIAASTFALGLAGGTAMRAPRLVAGALAFGGAIAGMHYIGMSAIRAAVTVEYDVSRVTLSLVVAVVAAAAALWLAFRLRDEPGLRGSARRAMSAVVMGIAVAGMHFTAVSAMHFHAAPGGVVLTTPFDGPLLVGRELLASVIAISLLVLIGAITAAMVDQAARREFREARVTLEHRVAEHEAEAAMATELYCLLAENATDMVSTHRPDGRFDYATQTWSEFIGVPIHEIVGHLPAEFAHPDDVSRLIESHVRALKSPEVLTTVWRCRRSPAGLEPTYAWVETSTRPVRDLLNGRVQTFVCATRDVTERKRMEDQLARGEARFRAALEGSFDAFFVLDAIRDANGHVVDFAYSELNARAEALLARHRSTVLGRRVTEVLPAKVDTLVAKLAAVVDSRVPLEEEAEVARPGAPSRWVHHQIIPLGDGVAITSRDVTDRKQAEEELRALTLVDDLTGLYNRRGFRMLAEQHLRLVKRGGPISLLVCFDLDDFKRVNDVYGHAEGDAALRRAASILRTAFRDSDIIARVGGDEFIVLALDCGEMLELLLCRVEMAIDSHNDAAARPYTVSLSLGTARLDPFAPRTLDELIAEADTKLYEAKRRRVLAREMMA
jgi:diguanylate cyclase (GGDEF)-like protein/PAS domain S-box-containing protein